MPAPRPYPTALPPFDGKRFIDALDSFGHDVHRRFIGLVHVLSLYGKLDEMSDMIERHMAYIHPFEEPIYADEWPEIKPFFEAEFGGFDPGETTAPFVPGEFAACDDETFIQQLKALTKGDDDGY